MQLYLVRHGIAIDRDDPACPDEAERFLTEKGIERTREAARGIRRLGVEPDLLMTSPYVRARQTAEIVAKELEISLDLMVETEALLPFADPADLAVQLRLRRGATVMAFGHAPQVDELIAWAIGLDEPGTRMKKAGMAILEWTDFEQGGAQLLAVYPAKALRLLGD